MCWVEDEMKAIILGLEALGCDREFDQRKVEVFERIDVVDKIHEATCTFLSSLAPHGFEHGPKSELKSTS